MLEHRTSQCKETQHDQRRPHALRSPKWEVAEEIGAGVPVSYALHQNYPNPFNPTTRIEYDLPLAGHVELAIFDLVGREVVTLIDEMEQPGYKVISFGSGHLASGVYFYRLVSGPYVATKKMVILK
ncbi:MAG: Cytochrome [Bacteroidetes bacterium]|nr:Cytochrome [Bacteroidota bacterium]